MKRLKEIAISVVEEQSEFRPLYLIAQEIRKDWRNVNFGAKPYLDAMQSLDSINDNYGADSGAMIVAYFLSNASTWKGETAKRVKAELNGMLKKRSKSPANTNNAYNYKSGDPLFKPGSVMDEQDANTLNKVSQMKKSDPLQSHKPEKFALNKGIENYNEKISPIVKRQIEYLNGVLPYLKNRQQDYKMVKDMLDTLEKEGLRPLSDKQLSMVSYLLSKVLKESVQILKENINEFIGQYVEVEPELVSPELKKYGAKQGKIVSIIKNVDNRFYTSIFGVKFLDGQVKEIEGKCLLPVGLYAPEIPVGVNEQKKKK